MSFIKNIWYAGAWSNEVLPGKPMALTIADLPIVIYRTAGGHAVALEDRCSHRCAPLSKGRVEGDSLRCWYHGLLFSQQGKCLEMPGQDMVDGFDVRSFPVAEKHECIWVWTGDPAMADPAMVPNSNIVENGISCRTGVLDYASDYQLINDNLCDFSHVAYVHEHTLGQGSNEWAHRLPTLSNLENGIRSTRWIEGTMMPPTPGVPPGLRIDQYTTYDYVLPGVLIMQISAYPPGKAKEFNFAPPPESMEGAVYVLRTLQMATPVTQGKARYLFSASHPLDPSPDQSLGGVMGLFAYAFQEDKDMIEAQQSLIDKNAAVRLRNTKHDIGLMRVRRLISNRIREEQLATAARTAAE